MYQGVCTHCEQERHVVGTLKVDPKQTPDNICDVRNVLGLFKSPYVKFTYLILPKTLRYRYRGRIPRMTLP